MTFRSGQLCLVQNTTRLWSEDFDQLIENIESQNLVLCISPIHITNECYVRVLSQKGNTGWILVALADLKEV